MVPRASQRRTRDQGNDPSSRFADVHGIEHAAVHSATLKKWDTGSGRADKGAMLAAVRARWKPDVAGDDEADALALLHYALDRLVPLAAGTAPPSPPR